MAVVLLSACGGGNSPPPPPRLDTSISLTDRLGVPVDLHDGGGGMFVTEGAAASVTVSNDRKTAVTIVSIDPIGDPGLLATYLGHTTCKHGCIGTGFWDEPGTQQIIQHGIEGVYPVLVPPDGQAGAKPEHLVFRLRVTAAAMTQLRRGCLWLRALKVHLSDGHIVLIDGFGDRTILGIFADDHALSGPVQFGPQRCPLDPTPSP